MGPRVVVGVDGSAASRAALGCALEEARWRHAMVEVVHAYPVPAPGGSLYGASFPTPPRGELERDAMEVIEHTLGVAPDDVEVERIVTPGPAAAHLLHVARGAELLVVGSRGRGGFAGLLLGSTSQHVVRHAPCPVLVVPAPATTEAAPEETPDESSADRAA